MSRDTSRPDLYTQVTDAILADLEAGVRPWIQPWSAHGAGPVSRPRRANGAPYAGINVLLLWSRAMSQGFAAPTWMTFRQALALGGQVRRGAQGATVVYANRFRRKGEAGREGDAQGERSIPFLKAYTVFNVEQIEGLAEAFYPQPFVPRAFPCLGVISDANRFFAATGARIRYGGDRAYYAPGPDYIQTPVEGAFPDIVDFYATLAHETVHWTGHASRLNRVFGGKRGGDDAYAREELVAELGAAFLCADLGLELRPRRDHADYIASWLSVLRGDTRFVVRAAALAQRACDYLHGLQPDAAVQVTQREDAAM